MSDARETIAFRNQLQTGLTLEEIRNIAWPALTNATAKAIAAGWTGDEIARWCLADLNGKPPNSPGAVILTTIRRLAETPPPRETTPTPPPIDRLALARDQRAAAGVNHGAWAARIRADLHQQETA